MRPSAAIDLSTKSIKSKIAQIDHSNSYILQLSHLENFIPQTWATSTSNASDLINLIHLSPNSSWVNLAKLKFDHLLNGTVTQIKSNHQKNLNSQILIAAFSIQPILAGWDPRCDNSSLNPTFSLSGTSNSPFISCDISTNQNFIVAGTDHSTDPVIEIFDLRGNHKIPFSTYHQSHSNLITSTSFAPQSIHHLLSASTDGLLVTYDIRISNEDDAIMSIANLGASIALTHWNSDNQLIWAATDMETLSVWSSDDLSLIHDYGDLRHKSLAKPDPNWNLSISHLIDCIDPSPILQSAQSAYFAGSSSGDVILVDTSDTKHHQWNVLASLTGGHDEIVRCASIDNHNGLIVTGGEDGRICAWSDTNIKESDSQPLKIKSFFNHPGKIENKSLNQKRFKPY
ncbi:hypothetical protein O181_073535 [Austropuccinia psidii MF-1]|uniref:WD40 repeat-like protein n=1 Tax=Austropuccinia psidii MF-1 TaxID=1389203 RepID=A0A9Q3F2Q0_9BASI|nr:hypothetical protein [Austropuccinia psidii MF-1]